MVFGSAKSTKNRFYLYSSPKEKQMKKNIIVAILLTLLPAFGLYAAEAYGQAMLTQTPYAQAKTVLGKGKPAFFEVGSDTCKSCRKMGKKLYAIAQAHPEYLIKFINVKEEREAAIEMKIMMIPTQIIFDADGKEVYRHVGILEDDELNGLLSKYEF